ncbi:hypothetical protein M441DRAFT_364649 [Trichoderma asperellum CBS 433.97]|uniref:Secreted protein n=1 Tax=Trichoderma asperellum (strain ATCC 204424 / CBS 433.97 / NBRC 101777) TaxID=1042311 RepID=A0A2T3ZE33_TRIA4|nr:hypothetical protein M441DRAFT_364649 [Trichoderma asperellum CBS 433.97]PTB43059.1 hypothetical protein M441DRAFT_364649 [Trichoderma asperellum CBS 433.97]
MKADKMVQLYFTFIMIPVFLISSSVTASKSACTTPLYSGALRLCVPTRGLITNNVLTRAARRNTSISCYVKFAD